MQNVLDLTYELKRIKALLNYQILDTPNEPGFDQLVKIASIVFKTPVAAVTFIDEDRQWIKAGIGLSVCETNREEAVCNYTICENIINEIEDLHADNRFSNFPYVAGDPFYRFYAGIPLTTENNYRIGAFCILDHVTRRLNDDEKNLLIALGSVAMEQVEISLRDLELKKINQLQKRIACLLSHEEKAANTASDSPTDKQKKYDSDYLSRCDLMELQELLQRHFDATVNLLNEKIRWKEQALQQAVNNIQSNTLKETFINAMKAVNSAA